MDIMTLNAVIAKLQTEVDHCHNMIRWAMNNGLESANWCNSKLQAQHAVDMVQAMLDAELAERDNQEEAA